MLDPVTAEQAATAPFPFAVAQIDEGCGEAARLFDDHAPMLLGATRSGDSLLAVLARIGDDVDYLRRAHGGIGRERRNAWEHVDAALAHGERAALELQTDGAWPYGEHGFEKAQNWARAVQNDRNGLGALRDHLERYAFAQGLDPILVRARMLTAFFEATRADLAARRRGLAAVRVDEDERAWRQRYLDASDRSCAALYEVMRAYVEGQVTSEALRQELIARANAAAAVFQAAWDAETARVPLGVDPAEAR